MAQEPQEVEERTRPRRPDQHGIVNIPDVKHIHLEDTIQKHHHSGRRTVRQRVQGQFITDATHSQFERTN